MQPAHVRPSDIAATPSLRVSFYRPARVGPIFRSGLGIPRLTGDSELVENVRKCHYEGKGAGYDVSAETHLDIELKLRNG